MYVTSSPGSRSIKARATVNPPNPESNMPIAPSTADRLGTRCLAPKVPGSVERNSSGAALGARHLRSQAPGVCHALRVDVAERWTSAVVLGDGTSALIRPIMPADAEALA